MERRNIICIKIYERLFGLKVRLIVLVNILKVRGQRVHVPSAVAPRHITHDDEGRAIKKGRPV